MPNYPYAGRICGIIGLVLTIVFISLGQIGFLPLGLLLVLAFIGLLF